MELTSLQQVRPVAVKTAYVKEQYS